MTDRYIYDYNTQIYDDYDKYWLIKLWTFVIIIITIVYIFIYLFWTDDYPYDPRFIRSMTPAYPPPLINFMDPPNVFSKRFYPVEYIQK